MIGTADADPLHEPMPDANPYQRTVQIVEQIYRATVDPEVWSEVAASLSREMGGAAVGIALSFPMFGPPGRFYDSGFLPEWKPHFEEHFERDFPWKPGLETHFVGRFARGDEVFPDARVASTDFYRKWMAPQGFAPVGPLFHMIDVKDMRQIAGVAIYRREDSRPFDDDDLAFCNRFVPHLARAYEIYKALGGAQRARLALAEVVDRLPTGVLLIDSGGRVLVRNRAADRLLAFEDGFAIEDGMPRASDARDDAALRQLLEAALAPTRGATRENEGVMALSRPSGRRPYTVFVTPLLEVPYEPMTTDAVAALFVSDPDSVPITTVGVLQTLYGLTPAEAELVQLLARGYALDEAASLRCVSVHTARSQLKHVFAKTDTKRQGELVRLVLTGIASVDDT